MKIAVVSKSDAVRGGASRVAETLARLLDGVPGIGVHHWMAYPGIRTHDYVRKLHGGRLMAGYRDAANALSRAVGLPDFLTPEIFIHWARKDTDYDIYHLHDVSDTLSPLAIHWLAHRKPVIWTIHDCSPLTGGCVYPMECNRYKTRCGSCPQLDDWPLSTSVDLTGFMQKFKRRIFKMHNVVPVAPSNWMADMASESGACAVRPAVIPNSVNSIIFRPMDKKPLRSVLGIPEERFIVLLSAWYVRDRRKGVQYAVEALKRLVPTPYLLVVGHCDSDAKLMFSGLDACLTGHVTSDVLLAQYYAAADVFLSPSIADNLPNVILETMATGTPTIAFRAGGIPDMIDHDDNGWLAEVGDVSGLVLGLQKAMSSSETLRRWGEASVRKAKGTYSENRFLTNYLELYKSVMNQ